MTANPEKVDFVGNRALHRHDSRSGVPQSVLGSLARKVGGTKDASQTALRSKDLGTGLSEHSFGVDAPYLRCGLRAQIGPLHGASQRHPRRLTHRGATRVTGERRRDTTDLSRRPGAADLTLLSRWSGGSGVRPAG